MDNTVDFSDLKEFIINNYNNNKLKKKRRKKIIIVLVNVLSILLLVGAGIGIKSIIDYKKDYEKSIKTQDNLKKLSPAFTNIEEEIKQVEVTNQEFNNWFNSLLDKNNDTVGWLKVKNAEIDMPIVKTNDNKYYLNHNYDKERNSMGWAFADYRNSFPKLSQNTIIYGHTYKQTLIFSKLTKLLTKSWLDNEDNLVIEFTTQERKLYFKIFSIYTTSYTDDYLQTNFTYKEYKNFITTAKEKSIRDFNVDIPFNTRILTLSTCYEDSNHRLVVHASLMEEENLNEE